MINASTAQIVGIEKKMMQTQFQIVAPEIKQAHYISDLSKPQISAQTMC
jgi:hypothetical protein